MLKESFVATPRKGGCRHRETLRLPGRPPFRISGRRQCGGLFSLAEKTASFDNWSASTSPLPADDARWFAAEVPRFDEALRARLQARFPSLRDIDDVVQNGKNGSERKSGFNQLHAVRLSRGGLVVVG